MSKHNAQGTDNEEIMYADEFVIDEGGIDLKVDGECVLGVSFDHVDNFQLAYEVLPEHFTFPDKESGEEWHATLDALVQQSGASTDLSDADLELVARLFLTALARRNGYEK